MGLSYQLSAISFAKQICDAASEKQVPFDFAQGRLSTAKDRSPGERSFFARNDRTN
jgi:hypothetical protein